MDLSGVQQGDLRLYPNRTFGLLVVLGQLVIALGLLACDIVLLCSIFLSHLVDAEHILIVMFCTLFTPFCIWFTYLQFGLYCGRSPTITIDRRGVSYNVGLGNRITLIPWHDIQSMYARRTGSRSSLILEVKPSRDGRSRYIKPKEYARFQQVMLQMPISQILQHIRERYSEELHQYGVQVL